jgi:glycosyltransferase involved in cell wall biosynthesis
MSAPIMSAPIMSAPIMSERLAISAFIIAKNEADRIPKAILSVRDWVDEVIVIDSGSTDDTVKVAEELGAKTYFNEWRGYGPQKVYGETLCRNKWVLNIDADEEATPETIAEIKALFANGEPEKKAFSMRTNCVFRFEDKPRRFAVSMVHGRLYNLDYAGFKDSTVHDSVVLRDGGKLELLKNGLNHYIFRSHHHTIEKVNFYSSMQAEDLFRKGRNPSALKLIFTPLWAFFKAYILRGYIFYGLDGVVRSHIYAFSRLIRVAKAREKFQEAEYNKKERGDSSKDNGAED